VRRTVALALVLVVAGCGTQVDPRPRSPASAAKPQRAELGWREPYPGVNGERLVFEVASFEVTADGWVAEIAVENQTSVAYESHTSPTERLYGVRQFPSGNLADLEAENRRGRLLVGLRKATEIDPRPPVSLRPGETWRARISARGSLAAGTYVRVVFGLLWAVGDPPEDVRDPVNWVTDRSYRLRP
jgi:hypothetical protein